MSRDMKVNAFDDKKGVFVRARLVENEFSSIIDERGFDLVWFTGLRDKKGVLIYEGDILETPYEYPGNHMTGAEEESGRYRGKVHYRPSKGFIMVSVRVKDDEDENGAWVSRGELEIRATYTRIIGNIHQHPELLKGE